MNNNNRKKNPNYVLLNKLYKNFIPDEFRIRIWKYLTHVESNKNKNPYIYTRLLNIETHYKFEIESTYKRIYFEKDFSKNIDLIKINKKLKNILIALSNFENIGFEQEMAIITSVILYNLQIDNDFIKLSNHKNENSEENTFWIMIYIIEDLKWSEVLSNKNPKISNMLKNLEFKINYNFKKLYKSMRLINKEFVSIIFIPCFKTIFTHNIPYIN